MNAGQKQNFKNFQNHFLIEEKHGILKRKIEYGTSRKMAKQLGLMKILQHGCKDAEEAGFV